MKTFKIRKFIFTNLFFLNLINLSNPVIPSSAYRKYTQVDSFNRFNLEKLFSPKKSPNNKIIRNFSGFKKEFLLTENFNQNFELEIQSDKQYQLDSVLYAEGNVVTKYKGNTLKADVLIYDRSKEFVEAEGNVVLVLGDQLFRAKRINFDFKNNQGSFVKVKGLIKTKNLLENLNFSSHDSKKVSSVVQKIKKEKVLHTSNGVNNWIFYADELKVKNDQWFANKAIFTNDLLETDQINFVINDLKITPNNDSLDINSSINFLVLGIEQ